MISNLFWNIFYLCRVITGGERKTSKDWSVLECQSVVDTEYSGSNNHNNRNRISAKFRCQFHHILMSDFFAQKCFAQLFSNYSLDLWFFLRKNISAKVARKKLMKLTTDRQRSQITSVTSRPSIRETTKNRKTKVQNFVPFYKLLCDVAIVCKKDVELPRPRAVH